MATDRKLGLMTDSSSHTPVTGFNRIKVGRSTLENDAFLDLEYLKPKQRRIKRSTIERAIENQDLKEIRAVSNYFFYSNGIYQRLCRYMAFLYRYDWFITPIRYSDAVSDEKVIEGWEKASRYLDNCDLKRTFGNIALKVVRDGCFYGYVVEQKNAAYIQQLPIEYCRSRYNLNNKPAVEFNVKYFDDKFSDIVYREKVLKLFPKEFRKAYIAFKKGTLPKDTTKDDAGWFLIEGPAVKFNLNGSDYPLFLAVIPKLLDLEDAQDLDKKRMAQQLIRLVIQEMPLDKNNESVFDIPDIQAFHDNAVQMVGDAVGISVLTTLADVKVEDLSDNNTLSSADQLEKIERGVYNESGTSQGLFNTDGNLALEKSIENDAAVMTDLLLQFEDFAESLLKPFNKNINKLVYRVSMLPTTIHNYKDLAQTYKEQTMIGFSKLLPQVALGQSPSVVLATAFFENEMLNLEEIFTPPQMSSTISADDGDGRGRPEKEDDQKSEKTMENIETSS